MVKRQSMFKSQRDNTTFVLKSNNSDMTLSVDIILLDNNVCEPADAFSQLSLVCTSCNLSCSDACSSALCLSTKGARELQHYNVTRLVSLVTVVSANA